VTAPGKAYDVEPWTVRERRLDLQLLGRTEAVFALSNGHIGLRANLDEGEPCVLPGTYLNAFYERRPLPYAERAYGLPDDGQTMINVTNGKLMRLLVDDEQFDVRYGELLQHERVLDLRDGVLRRDVHWRSPTGRMIRVRSTRMVSLVHRSVAAILYEVEPVDVTTRIVVQSELVANEPVPAASADPRAAAALERALRAIDHSHCDLRATLLHATESSGLIMAAAMDHGVEGPDGTITATETEPDVARVTVTTELEMGQTLRIVKLLAYAWSSQRSSASLRDQVEAGLASARRTGWNGLLSDQRGLLTDFWQRADVEVGGSPELQQALRFGMFHTLQAGARAERNAIPRFGMFHTLQAGARAERNAIPAKGLTGRGYDGHAFWDMDTFVCAALTYTYPEAAANALRWRHSVLDLARERARTLGRDGAAFPWRTIRGQECSGYWPAGTAAFHINADIAEAVRRYVTATGDEGFERSIGLELLVETARLWRSLGHFDSTGTFRISGVTGPDEYSAIADDNLYTNLMAARNLSEAAAASARHPERARALGVDGAELERWREAAQAIAVPYDAELGVHEQAAGFTRHRRWNFARTRPGQYPLLLHFPYYELYRSQVVKQADLVLALYLCGERFDADQKARDFDYYEAITVRDSSLSAPLQAIVAAEVGHLELALDYLGESAFVDLHDLGNDTCDGVHLASLAASWLAVVAGFGGMRDHGDTLAFAPRLPRRLERLSFRLVYRGRCLRVEVVEDEARYELLAGDHLELVHHGERFTLRRRAPASHAVPAAPERQVPEQPAGRKPRGLPGLESAAAAARSARGA